MDDGVVLVTNRLVLRRWHDSDEEPLAMINSDPEVTQFLNRPTDRESVQGFFAMVNAHWDDHGYGILAVESSEQGTRGALLGFVGVALPTFLPELSQRPELGWRLRPSAWGRGLATEAATAVRDHAFSQLGMDELISIIHPDNIRSQSVATKLGMRVEGQAFNPFLSREVDIWSTRRL